MEHEPTDKDLSEAILAYAENADLDEYAKFLFKACARTIISLSKKLEEIDKIAEKALKMLGVN